MRFIPVGVAGGQTLWVMATVTSPSQLTLLVIAVDDLRLGIAADAVLEVHRMVAVTRIAGAPAVIEGLVDVRGIAVPVVDLRRRLGRPTRPPKPSDHLVELTVRRRRVALHVDRALDVTVVAAATVDAAPAELDYAAGLVRLDDGLLVVHDLAAFLTEDEGLQLDEALTAS